MIRVDDWIECTDVRHAPNRLFETVKELSLAVSVLACVLQRELDDLSDVQTSLDSGEVDDETTCGFVLVDRGVYSFFLSLCCIYESGKGGIYPPFPLSCSIPLDQFSPHEAECDRIRVQAIELDDRFHRVDCAMQEHLVANEVNLIEHLVGNG